MIGTPSAEKKPGVTRPTIALTFSTGPVETLETYDGASVEIEELERLLELDGLDDAGCVGPLQQGLKLLVLADGRSVVRESVRV